jgi:chloramphenicol 3-O-phosphotransferase
VAVEVEGAISNGVLMATKLSVRQSGEDVAGNNNVNIEMEAVASAANPASNTFVVLTKTVTVNALTQFEDKSSAGLHTFNLTNIVPNVDRLAVRAYKDNSGNLIATRVERTDPDSRIVLQGPVDAKTIATNLTIVGVTVQTGPSTQYRDAAGNTLTPSAFFNAVAAPPATPSIVKVQGVAGAGAGSTIDATNGEADIEG